MRKRKITFHFYVHGTKKFKYNQAGLEIAKSAPDSVSYANLELKAKMFRTNIKKYRKEERDICKVSFAIGKQSEQDVVFTLKDHNRWRNYRVKEKRKAFKMLAQLCPSKLFMNQIRKPAKDS